MCQPVTAVVLTVPLFVHILKNQTFYNNLM